MTGPTTPSRYAFEYPDGKGTLSQDQTVLIDELIDNPHTPASDFEIIHDEKTGVYEAVVGDREIAGLSYNIADDDRLVLLAVSVFPEFRRRGVATELIRHVLDDVRAEGKTVTIMCPIVHTFIDNNPEYAGLVNSKHPGLTRKPHRS